jgi:putative DNA primase/helicase
MAKKTDFTDLFNKLQNNVTLYPAIAQALADELDVIVDSINRLGVGFHIRYQAWAFAERNAKGKITGISLRGTNGKKFMVEGSKHGLFYEVNNDEPKYKPGPENWVRVNSELPCPICGKSDGCAVASSNPTDPPAVMCVHRSEGSVKPVELGYLHILKPEGRAVSKSILIQTSSLPILVVEGASDVLTAMDLGFVAIGRPSAEGGMDILAKMPLHGKEIWVIGENDSGAGRSGMQRAFATVQKISPNVTMFQPPEGIKDLRDWKNKGLTQTALIEYAKEYGKTNQDENIFKSDDPAEIGTRFLKDVYIQDNNLLLREYKGRWVHWIENVYKEIPVNLLRGRVYDYIDGKKFMRMAGNGDINILPYKASRAKVSDIIDSLNRVCPIENDPPTWLDNKKHTSPSNLITFNNGVLDVNEYIDGKIVLHNPDPNLFTFNIFPYNFDEDADSKLFKEFRDDIFETDPIRDQLLAQWFGYNTVPDMSLDTVMLFTGVPRSGKSTLLDVLGRMLGKDQCVSIDFRDLISPFGREPMLGKLAALLGDVKSPRPADAESALEMILRISGGDPVGVNRKMIKALAQVYLTVRFTMAMNNLPVFSDHARAFQARLAIIGFDKSYVGREKPHLKQQLIKEAAEGKMINYALRGLKDLRERGKFIMPDSSRPILDLMTQISSPVVMFVKECCILGKDDVVSKDMLFDAWRGWCDETGHKPGLREQFGRWLASTVPMLKTDRIRTEGRRVYMYKGLKLQDWVTGQYLMGK